ncbi:Sulfotransferase family protein [Alteromonadaceae bacterium Bs31]|nr:Sulfotransferase family protein [Alteromonadaceae bacterium Bs31]
MRLPNFFIIGAAKCGTTSLQEYLNQHPDVYFGPYKEPNYYSFAGETLSLAGPAKPENIQELLYFHTITDLVSYQKQFEDVADEAAIGDASVRYLYYPETAERIKLACPDARLIVVLREPVSRLYSHYTMMVQKQLEPLPFAEAIEQEDARVAADWGYDWHYTRVSNYAEQLKRYFSCFDREQILIHLHDDLVKDAFSVYEKSCVHLGIDASFKPVMTQRRKVAYKPNNLAVDKLINWPNPLTNFMKNNLSFRVQTKVRSTVMKWNSAPVPKIDLGLSADLKQRFRLEVEELETLLGRSLPWYK